MHCLQLSGGDGVGVHDNHAPGVGGADGGEAVEDEGVVDAVGGGLDEDHVLDAEGPVEVVHVGEGVGRRGVGGGRGEGVRRGVGGDNVHVCIPCSGGKGPGGLLGAGDGGGVGHRGSFEVERVLVSDDRGPVREGGGEVAG